MSFKFGLVGGLQLERGCATCKNSMFSFAGATGKRRGSQAEKKRKELSAALSTHKKPTKSTPAEESLSPNEASKPSCLDSVSVSDASEDDVCMSQIQAKQHKSTLGGWKGWKKAFGDAAFSNQSKRRGSIWNRSEERKVVGSMEETVSHIASDQLGLPRDLSDLWVDKILPGWPSDNSELSSNVLLKSLICLGVPDEIRGEYWKKVIGNQLKLTPELYRILLIKLCSVRSQLLQSSQRYSNGLYMADRRNARELGPLDQIDNLKATIFATNPRIIRTRSSVPLHSSLHLDYVSSPIRQCRSFPLSGKSKILPVKATSLDFLVPSVDESASLDYSLSGTPTSSARYEVEFVKKSFEAIAVDLHRTVPRHAQQNKTLLIARGSSFSPTSDSQYSFSDSRGLLVSLRSVLEAWVVYRPDIGYVQGMACVAATLLFTMDEFSSFVCLSNLLCKDTLLKFYRFELPHIKLYCRVFDFLLEKYFPRIFQKIQTSNFTSDVFLIEWWFTLFTR
eukprot:Gregarina_sp_Poly_1__5009@NODE_2655_length_1868_cov_51_406996_g143_i1_p1_GENE_NODE_2655_length_1868_cov_51_406996_g143_i1NODE_2655_length_1868_cov_51_406996_g143_i1_p1_ORF_typecomplete_len506_score53_14RabGAPTBC/PF00566_18/2_6e03RabGAPTBC/PF00566_18/1e30_NODE_2655_length_1868_cov_51_406996_g143_i1121529